MQPPDDDVIRVRLRYLDIDTFVQKFAPNVTRGGIFLASRMIRPVGDTIRFEVYLKHGDPILSGEGKVTWIKEFDPTQPNRPYGMGVQFLFVDPDARPILDKLLKFKASSQTAAATGTNGAESARPTQPRLTFEDLGETMDDTGLRRVVEKARALAARTEDPAQLMQPEAEEPVSLEQALADLPRLLGRRTTTAMRAVTEPSDDNGTGGDPNES